MSQRHLVIACMMSAIGIGLPLRSLAADSAPVKERVLYNFKSQFLAGDAPSGGFVADAAGNLYGVSDGGTYNMGTVFRLHPNGDGSYTKGVIYSFQGSPDAARPTAPLVFDAAGNLYGSSNYGGLCSTCGAIFELSPKADGTWKETVISTAPANPANGLTIDKAGNLYGTTQGNSQLAFELAPGAGGKWTYSVLHTFGQSPDGSGPNGLVIDNAGNLYGTTQEGGGILCFGITCGTAFELSPTSEGNWTETILYNFGNYLDGFLPSGTLTLDAAGNLYGTTQAGGSGGGCYDEACGVVFEFTPSGNGQWNYSVLYSFQGSSNNDGSWPNGGLIFDAAGNLYGTTQEGGSGNCSRTCGTAFELSHGADGWQESVLWRFTGPSDGENPSSGVTFGSSGQLLGANPTGGPERNGVIFQLTPSSGGTWQESSIVTFRSNTDGQYPEGLVEHNGNYYGTTLGGGTNGVGTVFELTPAGEGKWNENILYSFDIHQNALVRAISKLVFDTAGNMYGETYSGGRGFGEVFELSPVSNSWSEKVIYQFSGGKDGLLPNGGLAIDAEGNLYGTARQGGSASMGVVFELSPGEGGNWTESVIHNFTGYPTDGSRPYGGVLFDQSGNLYGTTSEGGIYGCVNTPSCGTVYKLIPGSNGTWTESILHSFAGGPNDGGRPLTEPVFDPNGNIFGSTASGGQAGNCAWQCGTVYELSPMGSNWNFTLLHAFHPGSGDGYGPSGLVVDQASHVYGFTLYGGPGAGWCLTAPWCGIAYELTPSTSGTWTETIIHNFGAYKWDATYASSLILGSDGKLYGTAYGGTGQTGVAFEIVPQFGHGEYSQYERADVGLNISIYTRHPNETSELNRNESEF